jgi:Flp pilus assembly protein TadD
MSKMKIAKKEFFLFLVFLAALIILPSLSRAAPPEAIQSVAEKLDRWEVEEAWGEVKGLLSREPKDAGVLELASQVAFHRGDYQEALSLIRDAVRLKEDDGKIRGLALFMEGAAAVITPLKRFESPHFIIALDEKQDGILVDYIVDGLEKTYRLMAQRYGFESKEKIRAEIFPDARAFYFASTLSVRDIEVTGAVGVTQFNKLMVLSPRALVYGYRWLDSLSHEYLHYLIMKVTGNKAPIWFHEGLAKYEETRWRSGPSYLSPLYQTLLTKALSEGKLIGFEKMEPSLVKLETPEEVQLAYAQAASAIDFIVSRAGPEGLNEIMRRMAASGSKGAAGPLRETLRWSFPEFEEKWRNFLSSKGLREAENLRVRPFRVKEGKATEEYLDMEEIKSMVARNRAHLGDLLKERGRMGAAVLEYRRALAETRDPVPILNRLGAVLISLNRDEEALDLLKRAEKLAPDHPTVYHHLGKAYLHLKNFTAAEGAFQNGIQINPFDPETHQGLAVAYERLGDQAAALKEKEIAGRLIR